MVAAQVTAAPYPRPRSSATVATNSMLLTPAAVWLAAVATGRPATKPTQNRDAPPSTSLVEEPAPFVRLLLRTRVPVDEGPLEHLEPRLVDHLTDVQRGGHRRRRRLARKPDHQRRMADELPPSTREIRRGERADQQCGCPAGHDVCHVAQHSVPVGRDGREDRAVRVEAAVALPGDDESVMHRVSPAGGTSTVQDPICNCGHG